MTIHSNQMPDRIARQLASNRRLLPKYLGCLLCGAAGDALGYAVEFMSYREIQAAYGAAGIQEYTLDSATGKALISDDTQMTLFTANAILIGDTRQKLRGISGDASCYAHFTYHDWLRTQEPDPLDERRDSWLMNVPELYHRRAPGNTCLQALRDGGCGSERDPINDSKGCGGVMRVAPAGLFFDNPNTAAVHASGLAALTHGHPLGYISAGAFAYIVSMCTHRVPLGESAPADRLREIVRSSYGAMRTQYPEQTQAVEGLCDLLERAICLAEGEVDDVCSIRQLGEGWVAEEALAIGVYAALRHCDDVSAALCAAVNHDGDSDSTGSICGNILGALRGIDVVDRRWLDSLELRNVIEEIATDLCDTCQMGEWGEYRDDAWLAKYVHQERWRDGSPYMPCSSCM